MTKQKTNSDHKQEKQELLTQHMIDKVGYRSLYVGAIASLVGLTSIYGVQLYGLSQLEIELEDPVKNFHINYLALLLGFTTWLYYLFFSGRNSL